MNTDWLPAAAALVSLAFPAKSHWWDAHLTLVSIITVNASANLLFGSVRKVGGRSDGRSEGCGVGCVQKAPSHYWGVKSFHTDVCDGINLAWQLLQAYLYAAEIREMLRGCKNIICLLRRSTFSYSIDLSPSAEQLPGIKGNPIGLF